MHFLLIIISLFAFFSCSQQETPPPAQKIPHVLTTIPPYVYFLERIGGNSITVQVLVPPGWDPHHFEPTPKQIEQMQKADLWLKTGEPFEKKIALALKERNPHMTMLEMWENLPLLSNHTCGHLHHEMEDLHVWLSPRLAKQQAEKIAAELSLLLPEHKEMYAERLELFLHDLDHLDQELSSRLSAFKDRTILVSHPAFAYFCRDYGLRQLSIDNEGKEPLPRDIAKTIELALENQVSSVIVEPQYGQKGARLIAEKLHLPIHLSDPYSADYINNLRHLAEIISAS